MKNNKKELEKKSKKEKAETSKEYIEEVPRFSINDSVLYFTETSTGIEKGIVVGIFIEPGNQFKKYIYQIEHKFKDEKKVERIGLCVPISKDVIGASGISKKDKEKFIKNFKKMNVNKLNIKIREYKDSIEVAKENVKKNVKYQKDIIKIIASLNKRKKEILNS